MQNQLHASYVQNSMPLYVALKDGENCFIKINSAINKLSLDWEEWIILKVSCSIGDIYIYIYIYGERERKIFCFYI